MDFDAREAAQKAEEAVMGALHLYAGSFVGLHATRRVLEEIGETITQHVWAALPWGREHFRFEASVGANRDLDLTFVPLSPTGIEIQDAGRETVTVRP